MIHYRNIFITSFIFISALHGLEKGKRYDFYASDGSYVHNAKLLEETDINDQKNKLDTKILWENTTISVWGSYLITSGPLKNLLPTGWEVSLSYEQGLERLWKKRAVYLPGLRMEGSYLNMGDSNRSASGFSGRIGPQFFLPVLPGKNTGFYLALLTGMTSLKLMDSNFQNTHLSFSWAAVMGFSGDAWHGQPSTGIHYK